MKQAVNVTNPLHPLSQLVLRFLNKWDGKWTVACCSSEKKTYAHCTTYVWNSVFQRKVSGLSKLRSFNGISWLESCWLPDTYSCKGNTRSDTASNVAFFCDCHEQSHWTSQLGCKINPDLSLKRSLMALPAKKNLEIHPNVRFDFSNGMFL